MEFPIGSHQILTNYKLPSSNETTSLFRYRIAPHVTERVFPVSHLGILLDAEKNRVGVTLTGFKQLRESADMGSQEGQSFSSFYCPRRKLFRYTTNSALDELQEVPLSDTLTLLVFGKTDRVRGFSYVGL